jgi:hypothetical protein
MPLSNPAASRGGVCCVHALTPSPATFQPLIDEAGLTGRLRCQSGAGPYHRLCPATGALSCGGAPVATGTSTATRGRTRLLGLNFKIVRPLAKLLARVVPDSAPGQFPASIGKRPEIWNIHRKRPPRDLLPDQHMLVSLGSMRAKWCNTRAWLYPGLPAHR